MKNVTKPLHKRWKDYTTSEIVAIKRSKCMQCPYKGVQSSRSGDPSCVYCNYLEITGEARIVRPELCEHYLDTDVVRVNGKFGYGASQSGLA